METKGCGQVDNPARTWVAHLPTALLLLLPMASRTTNLKRKEADAPVGFLFDLTRPNPDPPAPIPFSRQLSASKTTEGRACEA